MFKKLERLVRKYTQKLDNFIDNHKKTSIALGLFFIIICGVAAYFLIIEIYWSVNKFNILNGVQFKINNITQISNYSFFSNEIIFDLEYTITYPEKIVRVYIQYSVKDWRMIYEGQTLYFRTIKFIFFRTCSKSGIINFMNPNTRIDEGSREWTFIRSSDYDNFNFC